MNWPRFLIDPLCRFLIDPLRRVDEESRAYLASEASHRPDRKVLAVLVTTALCLTGQRYLAMAESLVALSHLLHHVGCPEAGRRFWEFMFAHPDAQLHRLTWWAVLCLVTYVVIPGLVVRLVLRERLGDYGVKARGAFADLWVYAVLMALAWPTLYVASAGLEFQEIYPFYRVSPSEGLSRRFWLWEGLYFAQFFGVEFFFRGFLLHGLRQRFGVYAIFAMMVPYCMLHFLKPLPETLVSILGAVVLGFMSLRTRSIWMGTVIHVSIAGSMDLLSLWRQGLLF